PPTGRPDNPTGGKAPDKSEHPSGENDGCDCHCKTGMGMKPGGGENGKTGMGMKPGGGENGKTGSGHGNNGVSNGKDPQPPGNPPVNDGSGTGPGNPGNRR